MNLWNSDVRPPIHSVISSDEKLLNQDSSSSLVPSLQISPAPLAMQAPDADQPNIKISNGVLTPIRSCRLKIANGLHLLEQNIFQQVSGGLQRKIPFQ